MCRFLDFALRAPLEMTRGKRVERSELPIKTNSMYNTYYVYFLTSSNNSALYIGVTNDLKRRIEEHRSGLIPGYTQKYNCHKLVYFEEYSDVNEAISREKQLKKWSRSKKNDLVNKINPEWKELLAH